MLSDFKHAWRRLSRSPGFSLAVVVTLALCIGANSAVMSVLYGLVLKPLPYAEPSSLVAVYNSYPKVGQSKRPTSVTQYVDFKAHASLLTGLFLWSDTAFTVGDPNGPNRVPGARASGEIFDVLRLHPVLGHFYTAADSALGRDHVIVLTQSFWEAHFQADPDIVGKTIRVDGTPFTIVAVAPRSFEAFDRITNFVKPFEWIPDQATEAQRESMDASMYGRLKPGVTRSQAEAQLASLERAAYNLASQPTRAYLDRSGHRVEIGPIEDIQIAALHPSLVLLQIGVGLVLLLGCVNVANLILARANGRQTEFAVRQALGAGAFALVRPLFVEAVVLSLTGAIAGLALARASLSIINDYIARIGHMTALVSLDQTILGGTLAVSLLVALGISILPAVQIWRSNLRDGMQAESRGSSGSIRLRSTSSFLVSSQVALALMLLAGAGVLVRSLERVLAVNLGFDSSVVIHCRVAGDKNYNSLERQRWLSDQVVSKLKEIPGVENVALSAYQPVGVGAIPVSTFTLRGDGNGASNILVPGHFGIVSPGFFDVMGIHILAGRDFTPADGNSVRPVLIADRAFAERYFGGRQAVGHGVNVNGNTSNRESDWPLLVGIVENAALNGPGDQSGVPNVYSSLGQSPWPGFSILLRTSRPLESMMPQIRAKVNEIDPSLPLYSIYTIQQKVSDTIADRRGVTALLSAFASIAW